MKTESILNVLPKYDYNYVIRNTHKSDLIAIFTIIFSKIIDK